MAWDEALLWLAGICGAVISVGGVIGRMTAPLKSLSSRLEALETRVEKNEAKLVSDMAAFRKQEDFNVMVLKSLGLLLQHGATGNHNEQMKDLAEELNQFLYGKSGKLN